MNNKADISLIKDYLNGKLNARAMYELERRAQDNPELMDLMLGMETGNTEEDSRNLFEIEQLIQMRVEGAKTKRMIPWSRWAVAASLFLCISIAAFLMLNQPGQKLLEQADKQVNQKRVSPPATGSNAPNDLPINNEGAPLLNRAAIDSVQRGPVQQRIAMLKPKFSASKTKAVISEQVLNPSMAKNARKAVALSAIDANNDTTLIAANSVSEVTMRGSSTVPVNSALAGKVAGIQIDQSHAQKVTLVQGKVTDAEGNIPLPGVAIRLGKEKKGVYTDAKGKFSLKVPASGDILLASMIGFDQKIVQVNGYQDSLNIVLNPSTSALNEVVVVGYGKANVKEKVEKAHPAQGWDAYNEYLKENATVVGEKGGKVIVAFSINQHGAITDLRIVKSSGKSAIDGKALALILTGPKWVGHSDGGVKEITLKIKFH